ncbi:MAG TPA: CBS domain-containing protein [Burkholderiales bacterium]|nr:CBS domain-containing protein [Burkholderiales bacterium]
MKIRDFCTTHVVVVEPGASLREASLAMRNAHVGCVVVAERRGGGIFPLGVVTDRDIVVAVLAPGARPETIRAADAMPAKLAVIGEEQGVHEASRMMAQRGVRRLPVVRADVSLCGIVTSGDLARVLAAELSHLSGAQARSIEQEQLARPSYGAYSTT